MNRTFRNIVFVALAVGQLVIARHFKPLRLNVDLLYLVIFLIAIKSDFMPSVFSAAFIGFCSDFLSGGVMGVFSFSRTLAAYLLNTLARYLDLKKNVFIFLLILVSLFLSNLVAFLFLGLIFNLGITVSLLLLQPFYTAVVGTLILGTGKAKSLLDVS